MCGIVGYTGPRDAGPILLEGLRRLEYRGYDSAGIALVTETGDLFVEKKAGKLANLADGDGGPDAARRHRPRPHPLGHPRPPERPQRPSPRRLHRRDHRRSTTGSSRTSGSSATGSAARRPHPRLRDRHRGARPPHRGGLRGRPAASPCGRRSPAPQGAYAIAVMHRDEPDRLVGARLNVPLIVGIGDGETFLASDVAAILAHTSRVVFLEEGDVRRPAAGRDQRSAASTASRASASSPSDVDARGGREGRLRALHAQGDPRAAGGAPPVRAGPGRDATAGSASRSSTRSPTPARPSTGSSSSPAARPPTPRWSAPRSSSTGAGSRPASPSARSSATARRRSTRTTLVIAVTQSGETADTIAADPLRPRAGLPDRRRHEHRRARRSPARRTRCSSSRPGRRSRSPPRRPSRPRSRRSSCSPPRSRAARGGAAARRGAGARRGLCGRCPTPPSGRSTRAPASARSPRRYAGSRGFMFIGRGTSLPGGPRGRPQAQGDQLHPRRGLRGRRAEARPDLPARRRVPARRRRDPLGGLRQADQQRHGGPGPRRPGHRRRHRGRRRDRAATPTTSCGCRTRSRRSRRSWRSSRSSSSPTTWRSPAAATWTSRATSPSR